MAKQEGCLQKVQILSNIAVVNLFQPLYHKQRRRGPKSLDLMQQCLRPLTICNYQAKQPSIMIKKMMWDLAILMITPKRLNLIKWV